jgi:hypothetical protein
MNRDRFLGWATGLIKWGNKNEIKLRQAFLDGSLSADSQLPEVHFSFGTHLKLVMVPEDPFSFLIYCSKMF